MKTLGRKSIWVRAAVLIAAVAATSYGCGKAIDLYSTNTLGESVYTGSGSTRGNGASGGGELYPVNMVIPATQGNYFDPTASSTRNSVPDNMFNGFPWLSFADTTQNRSTPFYFTYTYPPNNFQLGEAHFIIDVQRDPTDTEGLWMVPGKNSGRDGVFTGRPPSSQYASCADNASGTGCYRTAHQLQVPVTSSTYPQTTGSPPDSSQTRNTYYIDYSLNHYKIGQINTFDMNIANLLTTSPALPYPYTPLGMVDDGFLQVAVGDDSTVYQGYLVIKGYTVSPTPLTCSNSPTYTFTNDYIHQDGNSIGQAAFTGTVTNPYTSWSAATTTQQSVEFYYDALLPQVDSNNVTINNGKLLINLKRSSTLANTVKSAIVINGIGASETGFDETLGTSAVEFWDDGAPRTYWNSFVAGIPANDTQGATPPTQAYTIDLIQLLGGGSQGAYRLKSLMLQGKLNIAIYGSVAFAYGANTATRTYGNPANGPELQVNGTYYNSICSVPNDPSSPLSGGGVTCSASHTTSPVISSVGASEITSSSAAIQWLTDETSTTEVKWGAGTPGPSDSGVLDTSPSVTFHRYVITGLQPYKVYTYQVFSKDCNNLTSSSTTYTFQTLR